MTQISARFVYKPDACREMADMGAMQLYMRNIRGGPNSWAL